MKLELEFSGWSCWTSEFQINGVQARSSDFGDQGDRLPDEADDYACADMCFTRKAVTVDVLKKYGITIVQYDKVAKKLEAGLSLGRCGSCQ